MIGISFSQVKGTFVEPEKENSTYQVKEIYVRERLEISYDQEMETCASMEEMENLGLMVISYASGAPENAIYDVQERMIYAIQERVIYVLQERAICVVIVPKRVIYAAREMVIDVS